MKTSKFILSLSLFLAVLLAACSPQAMVSDSMPVKDSNSESGMADKEDDMAPESSESEDSMSADSMPEAGDEMADHDDSMMDDEDKGMEDKDDTVMVEGEDDMSDKDDAMMDKEGDSMEDDQDSGMKSETVELPAWLVTDLTETHSGETFRIADFEGKVVLVETLAMWCSNCLKQQGQVKELHDLLGDRDDFISLGIDIDPNEDLDALKSYVMEHGFDWYYTVAPVEVAREIGQLYGDQYLNPPSTPMLIIDREGHVHQLPFGIKDADDLFAALKPFLEGEM